MGPSRLISSTGSLVDWIHRSITINEQRANSAVWAVTEWVGQPGCDWPDCAVISRECVKDLDSQRVTVLCRAWKNSTVTENQHFTWQSHFRHTQKAANTHCEPTKATSNQNARPWTCPVCCMSNVSGIMTSSKSDSDAVVKSMVYFWDCDMHTRVSNVSCVFHQLTVYQVRAVFYGRQLVPKSSRPQLNSLVFRLGLGLGLELDWRLGSGSG